MKKFNQWYNEAIEDGKIEMPLKSDIDDLDDEDDYDDDDDDDETFDDEDDYDDDFDDDDEAIVAACSLLC